MKFRHEYKFLLNEGDYLILRARLRAVMARDAHTDGRCEYRIRSLYFDTPGDKALREKLDGVNCREKFRIRWYNGDLSFISLEKKSKINGLCSKVSAQITGEEAQRLLDGDLSWMLDGSREVAAELYAKMKFQQLRPKTIVDYTREPFVFPAGNVRVTLDREIRTGVCGRDALSPGAVTIPAGERTVLLEVKYDEFLPDLVRNAVSLGGRRSGAFSKYAACRIYG